MQLFEDEMVQKPGKAVMLYIIMENIRTNQLT